MHIIPTMLIVSYIRHKNNEWQTYINTRNNNLLGIDKSSLVIENAYIDSKETAYRKLIARDGKYITGKSIPKEKLLLLTHEDLSWCLPYAAKVYKKLVIYRYCGNNQCLK